MNKVQLDSSAISRGVITPRSRDEISELLKSIVDAGVAFKLRDAIYELRMSPLDVRDAILHDLPADGTDLSTLLKEAESLLLPLCKNEASPYFCGFGDTGADTAALAGGLLDLFCQQNLINQSFDAPVATFVEIAVLRWLRDLVGYASPPPANVRSVWDVGGIVTTGGTMSNTVAMMLARERRVPGTMQRGVSDPKRFSIVVPKGIGHYSVKAAGTWVGTGGHVIEVPTRGFRYDLAELDRALVENAGNVMAVVAYAGDSRTQTIDDLQGIAEVVRQRDERIWLHADACWGLIAAFTPALSHRLAGIELFDSVTVDPHKVMNIPYSLSALLVREPGGLRAVSSYSDLIMQEDFAFGQVTPFVGTKGWGSLKLWAMMRAHGRAGLAALADDRIERASEFCRLIDASPKLVRLHDPDMAAVAFCYLPAGGRDIDRLNHVNKAIHSRMLAEGRWHLHTFTLPDDHGYIQRGAQVQALRFMANNPRTSSSHMRDLIDYIHDAGRAVDIETPNSIKGGGR
jgi:L-2,4-diaminobutyrate decarboxylase